MSRTFSLACAVAAILIGAAPVQAAIVLWDNDGGAGNYDFTAATNWVGDVGPTPYPTASDYTVIQNNSYADVSSAAGTFYRLHVGADQGGTTQSKGTGTLNILSGGSLNFASTCYIGDSTDNQGTVNVNGGSFGTGAFCLGNGAGSTGTLNVAAGTYTTNGYIYFGRLAQATGIVNLSGAASATINTTGQDVRIAYEANTLGVLNQSGGTFNATKAVRVGMGTSSVGVVKQSGGDLNSLSTVYLASGASSYGYYNLTGGQATVSGVSVSNSATGVGVMEQSAGSTLNLHLDAGDIYGLRVGQGTDASGLFNQKGGTVNCERVLWAGGNYVNARGQIEVGGAINVVSSEYTAIGRADGGSGKGYLNLNAGGVLTTPVVYTSSTAAAAGEAFLNFHGGTLKANSSTADPNDPATHFVRMPSAVGGVFLGAEGGTIDTDGHDVVISDPLQALAGYGVSGFTFTGGSGYDGPPIVTISGGSGRGATAVANVDEIGQISGITVTNPGTGYGSDDVLTVTLSGGGASTAAVVSAVSLAPNAIDGGLVKKGLGKLTLAGANTYVGLTDVQAGVLAMTGSLAGDVQVRASAKLLGAGTVGGDLAALAESLVAPGTSIGTLNIAGNASLAGTLDVEYDSVADAIDVLAVTGQLDLSGGTIQFSDLATTPVALDQAAYVFATYGSLAGSEPSVAVGTLPAGYVVDFDYGGNSIALVMVPEPGMLALLAGLMIGVLASGRRR